jgi:transposase
MHEIQSIITERVDDIPLLLAQMQRMGLPALLDASFPTHGHWQGLSLGWVSTIWLSSILSRGDHRRVHVAPWVGNRRWPLRTTTGPDVQRLDCTDDRLASGRRRLDDAPRWATFESALHQPTVRLYALPTDRLQVESTSASAYTTGTEEGLVQCGQNTEHRPALPHVKVMPAVLEPLGMPGATDVGAGERADAPLYGPWIKRGQAR